MGIAYLVVAIVLAAMVLFSGVGKLRNDPHIVKVIHETVGVPMKYFPLLAACEIAGAVGLVLGIWWTILGIAAATGLVIYFVGAVVSHVQVNDLKGIGPAAMLLTMSAAALILRVLAHHIFSPAL
jgi:uncharacterized membrane protein YphA (DoxX/SURF4 family)